MKNILEKLYKYNDLSPEELLEIITYFNYSDPERLFFYAQRTREKVYGKKVYMRGLIEFSNYCKQNCLYCGLRRENKNVERYRLSLEEIMECCQEGYQLGYRTFVLQSGEDIFYDDDKICRIIKAIREKFSDVAITLSIGEREKKSYRKYFEAGADRYLLRHETASEDLYKKFHPTMNIVSRQNCLQELKEIGFQTGAGFMVGLPGQRDENLVEDLLFLKRLQPHMVGIGPFIPHGETPLGCEVGGTVAKTLIMLALTRLLLPNVLLPATTAMGTLDPIGREKALKAGANVVMPNLSPISVREKYEIYQGKICTGDESAHCRSCIETRIHQAGFEVDLSRGDHITIGGKQ
ncbi:[FeFe] hydrogenase H-cluster radical SAM maturase HydE [Irregularibacter muris]|uniref:[FeFe] hydrogenase H-cluster radical SAM maturase HydE n=1 Tax=Irregularibacter muris TaxID=1796619 RepID=A0AAE3L354_9FIRM|nr:[FeFe] hydrogenase H-cluster radical SAM maturase HydE [Irregularibacter muris]MCR1897663.1 [FeFe] hydrogenase H-cluster radical SAM maturase HydE [Irregularibacter muris]